MPSDQPFPVLTEKSCARPRDRSGFALLITITLLAFLVLLLVSLASLTRVETQVASNSQQLAQARQNALLALNIAIGELQRFTGPDQRTTARADMNSAWTNTATVNGRWLGAYGNGAKVDTNYSTKPSLIPNDITNASNSKGSQAKLLNWLVSGNEGTVFDPSTTATVATDGHIVTAPSSFAYKPDSTINLATASATPAATDTQSLLVGANSASAPSDYVAAPLVTIKAPTSSVPGLGTSGDTTVGRYAWWVGDEGAKARVNLPQANSTQVPAAFVTAQRAAIEWVDKTNAVGSTVPFASTQLIGSDYDPAATGITKIVSPRQLALLTPTSATALTTAARLRFHDLTGYSTSVLTDVYAGGLKKDLSAVLATGASSPLNTDFIFPSDGTNTYGVPTWGMLRSFAQATTPTSGLDPVLPTSTNPGIYPVLTYAAVGMQYTAPLGDAAGNPIRLALFPIAVLWNPYTFPIKSAHYELGFNKSGPSPLQLQVAKTGLPLTTSTWTVKETLDFNRSLAAITGGDANADGSADVNSTTTGTYESGYSTNSYVRFVIDAPDLPAGASLIFTLQGSESGRDYDALPGSAPTNLMTKGISLGYTLVNKGTVIGPGETGMNFRVGINYDPANSGDRTIFSPAPAQYASMSGGEAAVYLAQVSSSQTSGYIASATNDKKWYQIITRTSPAQDSNSGGNILHGRNSLLQSSAPLTPPTGPTSVLSFFKTFTTANTVRWLAQANPRASMVTRTAGNGVLLNQGGGLGMETAWQSFTADSTHQRASAGLSLNAGGGTASDATLFEIRPDTQPLLSLGQLQHANLSQFSVYPAYTIGNSLGDFRFKDNRDKVWLDQAPLMSAVNPPTTSITSLYDLSWLLNRALWDRYFVSTVPNKGTGTSTDTGTSATSIPTPLPNPRITRLGAPSDTTLRDADKAAAVLLLSGGFNINSTSEQAWRAVLAGVNQLPYDPVNPTSPNPTPLKAALSRFSKPTQSPAVDATQAWAWQGYRQLTDEQIARLATNIVAEIRNRGPFISLADFINRRLVDNPATSGPFANEQFKGTLQAAIDATYAGASATNSGDVTAYGASGTNPFGSNTAPTYSTESLFDSDLLKGYAGSAAGNIPFGSISAFSPQFLTQADVLSVIGPGLSARSDTFTVRTYGEVMNPVTQEIQGRAWCEAVVQRMPEYVDDSLSAEATPAVGTINKQQGRRYKIISFRWLSSNDI
ncbi:MAG: hypothetical protein WC205_06720 [Opitutaceae bacterium]|jgi:hypothetical protein